MSRARGATLIELMVGLGVAVIGLAAIAAVVSAAGQMAMNSEMMMSSNDTTRLAVETMVNSLRNGGFGAQDGLVMRAGGVVQTVNPVYSTNNTGLGFSDELWVLVPHKGVYREGCKDPGAAVVVPSQASSATNLPVSCSGAGSVTQSLSSGASVLLLASAGKKGALMSNPVVSASDIAYAEIGANGFGTDSFGNGFNAGDQVFPVRMLHYFISMPGPPRCTPPSPLPAAIPLGIMPECAPGLYVADSLPNTAATNPPFVDIGGGSLVLSNVEDLQVAFGVDGPGTGNPANYAFQNGLPPLPYKANVRSVRISAVSRTARPQRTSDNGANTNMYKPMPVEDHIPPVGPPDGYRRTVYSRRIELINLAPRSL